MYIVIAAMSYRGAGQVQAVLWNTGTKRQKGLTTTVLLMHGMAQGSRSDCQPAPNNNCVARGHVATVGYEI